MTRTTDRRNFLKGIAAGSVTGGMALMATSPAAAQSASGVSPAITDGGALMAHPTITGDAKSDAFWAEVRSAFPLPENYIHMNTGTTGSQPIFAQHNLQVYNAYKSLDPRDWQANIANDYPDVVPDGSTNAIGNHQANIAAMYGANPDEIILSYNTTDGCFMVFTGIPWKEGDRIVMTNLEHSGMTGSVYWARDHHGVEVVTVGIPSVLDESVTIADIVDLFRPAFEQPLGQGNKVYLAISEIPYKNGVRFPIKELCALAREYGGYSIIDSAHGWGMLPVDCHDYGADFIAGAGHKWLCGGPGTGILYVRNQGDNLPEFGQAFRYSSANFGTRAWAPASTMQGRGEYNRPALFAMADTAAFFDHIGTQNIHQRGVELGNYLKDKVADRWGKQALWVQKNAEPAFATALTAFNPIVTKDDPAEHENMLSAMNEVVGKLAADTNRKVYIRTIDWRDAGSDQGSTAADRCAFRISTHAVYNSKEEVDYMFDSLATHMEASGLPLF